MPSSYCQQPAADGFTAVLHADKDATLSFGYPPQGRLSTLVVSSLQDAIVSFTVPDVANVRNLQLRLYVAVPPGRLALHELWLVSSSWQVRYADVVPARVAASCGRCSGEHRDVGEYASVTLRRQRHHALPAVGRGHRHAPGGGAASRTAEAAAARVR
jgi:hypothetical protein